MQNAKCKVQSGKNGESGSGSEGRISQATHPEVALLVSTYQKPEHLRRVLLSIALQEGVDGQFEAVVTDDGSTDQTRQVVESFARDASFSLRFVTHRHDQFQLARCRNEGVKASSAPYLLFLDGDCVLPRDHVRQHLAHRRVGQVMGGYCCRLDRKTSEKIDEAAIRANRFTGLAPKNELQQLAKRDRKSRFYNLIRHPSKPKLAGGNIGIWRSDYERVNGYDERFVGWGGEDDDLRRRLAATGVRFDSILRWTHTYHLWHPAEPTAVRRYWDGNNVDYLHQGGRLVCCRDGLVRRPFEEITGRIIGRPPMANGTEHPLIKHPSLARWRDVDGGACPEVELLFWPGNGRFSGAADCNVLVIAPEATAKGKRLDRRARKLLRQADRLLCDVPQKKFTPGATQFGCRESEKLFASIS